MGSGSGGGRGDAERGTGFIRTQTNGVSPKPQRRSDLVPVRPAIRRAEPTAACRLAERVEAVAKPNVPIRPKVVPADHHWANNAERVRVLNCPDGRKDECPSDRAG